MAGLFDIFILLHVWQNCVCFGDFLPLWTLCDAYHKEFESHQHSILDMHVSVLSWVSFDSVTNHESLTEIGFLQNI